MKISAAIRSLCVGALMLVWLTLWGGIARADTFVIVHGAFQDASAWSKVAATLRSSGHKTIVVNLPGRGATGEVAKRLSLDSYRDAALEAIAKETQPVILVGHSFGGFTISSVAEVHPEKIKRLVYVAAYLPQNGDSLQTLSATDKGSKFTQENFVVAADYSYADVLPRDRVLIFANGAPPAVQKAVAADLINEPLAPMASKVALTADRFGRVPKAYIKTLRDHAVSPSLQDMMIARTPVAKILTIDTGHTPQLSRPRALARLIATAAH